MKKLLLILTVALAGCGSNNNSNNNPEHTDYLSNKKIKEQYNDSLKDAKKANENALGNRIFRSIEELDRHEDYYYTSLDDIKDEIKFFKEKALYAQMTELTLMLLL